MQTFTNPSAEFWKNKNVLLTGHTGFKGAWLAHWLWMLGARTTGLSSGPLDGDSLYGSSAEHGLSKEVFVDIRDASATQKAIAEIQPDIVLHLAAQSLVRASYVEPIETFATNIMGTAHVLEALRGIKTCRAVVCVTSDKCYENREWIWPYREDEPMGGHDPYSSSKGAAELVVASMRNSFFNRTTDDTNPAQIGSARAGNVIGGGDWAQDRLIPDCIRAFENNQSVEIRNPAATRPWQHVLEPLNGYLLLAEGLAKEPGIYDTAWNFGPRGEDVKPVEDLVNEIKHLWGGDAQWHLTEGAQPHEAMTLNVDATKAKHQLGWNPRLSVEQALAWTVDWQKRMNAGENPSDLCREQIERYTALNTG